MLKTQLKQQREPDLRESMLSKNGEKFKLILGLGNKDVKNTIRVVLLYAQAGVRFFDFAPEIFVEVKKMLLKNKFDLNDFTLCVSVPSPGDIHGRKAVISEGVCSGCGLCCGMCPSGAIVAVGGKFEVDEKKCIGCGKCKEKGCYAISFEYGNAEVYALKKLIETGEVPDMVEFHCSVPNRKQIIEEFTGIVEFFKGDLSVCINRKQFEIPSAVNLLKELRQILASKNPEAKFYVQADGASMNGGNADRCSTLECVEFARELAPFGFNLVISGGTNAQTPEMLEDFEVKPIVAYGTYARKLIENLDDKKAIERAKELYDKTSGVLC